MAAILIHPSHQGVCERHGTEDLDVTPGGLVVFPGGTADAEGEGKGCTASNNRYFKPGESRVTARAAAGCAGEVGWQRWLVREGE